MNWFLPLLLMAGESVAGDAADEVLTIAEENLDQHWVESRTPAAVYPGYERRKGTEGCVRMGYIIEPSGRVGYVEVLFSVPPAAFERVAHNALKRWRFKPVSEPGPAKPIYTTRTFTFFPHEQPETLGSLAELCLPPDLEESASADDGR